MLKGMTGFAGGVKSIKFNPCTKCGSAHNRIGPFLRNGKFWCDYCGTRVTKAK